MDATNNTGKPKRVEYFSFLYVISAVAVVVLHANGCFWGYRETLDWKFSNVLECVFYFAVPIFFMLTGATLLDYRDRYDTATFLEKRFTKTVVPFLFWSVIAFLVKVIRAKNPKEYFSNEFTLTKIFNGFFNTEYQDVFWFFIPLFCVYLSIPLLSAIPKEKKIKVYSFTVIVAGLVNIVFPFFFQVINRFANVNFRYIFEIPVASGYLILVLLGYLLHHVHFQLPYRILVYCTGLIGLLTHIFGTQFLSAKQGSVDSMFKGYLNLPSVLYAIAIFVLVKYGVSKIKSKKLIRFVSFLQKFTFEFYLMHKLIFIPLTYLLAKVKIYGESPLFVLLLTIVTIPVCILITVLLRKVPVLKKIVP